MYAWGYISMNNMPVDRPIAGNWVTADEAKAFYKKQYFNKLPSTKEKIRDGLEVTNAN